jgi:hypothetical protein
MYLSIKGEVVIYESVEQIELTQERGQMHEFVKNVINY